MKKILFIVALISITLMCFSIEYITTTVTWASNQTITDNIEVTSTGSLTIDAGVTVTFSGDYYLKVQGDFFVNGASGSVVTFTATTEWQGLILDSISGCDIEYAKFENVEGAGAIQIDSCNNLLVDNCTVFNCNGNIAYSTSSATSGGILVVDSEEITISNCYIHDNEINDSTRSMFAGSAITIYESEDIEIIDCQIDDNEDVYDTNAYSNHHGAIKVKHACDLNTYTTADAITIKGTTLDGNISYKGGAIGIDVQHDDIEVYITDCKMIDNTAELHGGGLYVKAEDVIVDSCVIASNEILDDEGAGGGFYFTDSGCGNTSNNVFKNSLVYDNYSDKFGGGGAIYLTQVDVLNCTFADNSCLANNGIGSNPYYNAHNLYSSDTHTSLVSTLRNNIFYLSDDQVNYNIVVTQVRNGDITLKNNCYTPDNLDSNYTLEHDDCLFDEDPSFVDAGNSTTYPDTYGFEITEFSPCVNTGLSSSASDLDDDDSPHDIGFWAYDNTEEREFNSGIHWISFPRIKATSYTDPVWTNRNDTDETEAINIQLSQFEPYNEEVHVDIINEEDYAYWVNNAWTGGTETIKSHLGYKVELDVADELDYSGPRLPDETEVEFEYSGSGTDYFWLGFWKEGGPYNFRSFITEEMDENVTYIKHQNWYLTRMTTQQGVIWWKGDVDAKTQYGDMVMLSYEGDFDFPGYPDIVGNKSESNDTNYYSDYFTYEEQIDYLPIMLEVPDTLEVAEVGVYVDGVCRGFGKVAEDDTAYIRAYVLDENNPAEAELQFVYYFENSKNMFLVEDYNVIDPKTGITLATQIDLANPSDYYMISTNGKVTSFEDTLPVNKIRLNVYPNPMNSESLNIAYQARKDARLSVSVYNIKGQKVANVFNGISNTKKGELIWNGKDINGKSVANGIYFMRANSEGMSITEKFMIMK